MKQVLNNLKTGELVVADVPPPRAQPGGILIATAYSLISAGTERNRVDLARRSLIGKARQRPDQARLVLERVRRDGLKETYQRVQARLDTWDPLGYSCSGIVLEAPADSAEFRVGDWVAGAGGGHANHAEINFLPRNLAVPLPAGVDLAAAAFATVGAIALQGVRLAGVSVGETVAVIGLGLVGQLTVQILRAAGCRVIGLEIDPDRLALAGRFGALPIDSRTADAAATVHQLTGGLGADAVILAADTPSHEPIATAGAIARDRATIVAVGAVGLQLPRAVYYEKELQLRVSRSYGPGRYDPVYEEGGIDYPPGYVRWTERANLAAFLDLIADGRVDVKSLTTHEYPIERAAEAYDLLTTRREPSLGVLLRYAPTTGRPVARLDLPTRRPVQAPAAAGLGVSFIGAGVFARGTLLPAVAATSGVRLRGIATATGATARMTGEKFGFAFCTSDEAAIWRDAETRAVFIATRHDRHADLAAAALRAGRHVFVEKPLALTEADLAQVVAAHRAAGDRLLLVGFNRRFAPLARRLRDFLAALGGPFLLQIRVNAGPLPANHWLNDPIQGGGRLLGEGCHFVDLATYLAGADPTWVLAAALPGGGNPADSATVTLGLSDGSVATILYAGAGDPSVPKERLEVFGNGATAILDDFRTLQLTRRGHTETIKLGGQDKGHRAEVGAFLRAVAGGPDPAPVRELILSSLATLAIPAALATGQRVLVDPATLDRPADR